MTIARLLSTTLLCALALAARAQETSEPPDEETPAGSAADAPPAEVETIPVNVEEEAPPAGRDAVYLDTIEVTSQKRVKAQRDIPGSVGAIRGLDLEKMNAQGMKDYLKLVPGVTYIDQGHDDSIPIIRGISASLGAGGIAGTTGIYLDDMPFADLLGASSFPDINPFDLERVEVLKGPQGTLFGSGALAGAVRYIVERPKHGVWESKVSGTYSQTEMSNDPSKVAAAALNVPLLGDAVALRGVYVLRDQAGVYDESAHDDAGNELRNAPDVDQIDQYSWRALASWQILDDLKASAFWFDQHTSTAGLGLSSSMEEATYDRVPFPTPRNSDFGGGNLLLTWDLPWARVLSTSNRMIKDVLVQQHLEAGLDESFGRQNENEFLSVLGNHVKGWTQELRVMSPDGGTGGWEWLGGAAFLHYAADPWQYVHPGPDEPDPSSPEEVSPERRPTSFLFSQSHDVAEETALFGEITGRVGEHWEATLGARQYTTVLDATGVVCGVQIAALFPDSGGCRPDTFHDEDDGFDPKVALRYLHDRHVQAYVLAAKGFQFGGVQINPPAPGFEEAAAREGYQFAPYKSSELWNYELGVRTEWLDRRVRFDAALFYLDWSELQLLILVPIVQGREATFNLIANVAAAHSEGLETMLEVMPFEGARVTSSATWMNAVTDAPFDEDNSAGPVPAGTRLPGTPRFQWSNVVAYERGLPYFSDWVGGVALTHVHLGASPDSIRPEGTVGGYDTLDARLTLTKPGSRFLPEIGAAVNNLTDVRGLTFHSVFGIPLVHFVTPRTTLLTLAWSF